MRLLLDAGFKAVAIDVSGPAMLGLTAGLMEDLAG